MYYKKILWGAVAVTAVTGTAFFAKYYWNKKRTPEKKGEVEPKTQIRPESKPEIRWCRGVSTLSKLIEITGQKVSFKKEGAKDFESIFSKDCRVHYDPIVFLIQLLVSGVSEEDALSSINDTRKYIEQFINSFVIDSDRENFKKVKDIILDSSLDQSKKNTIDKIKKPRKLKQLVHFSKEEIELLTEKNTWITTVVKKNFDGTTKNLFPTNSSIAECLAIEVTSQHASKIHGIVKKIVDIDKKANDFSSFVKESWAITELICNAQHDFFNNTDDTTYKIDLPDNDLFYQEHVQKFMFICLVHQSRGHFFDKALKNMTKKYIARFCEFNVYEWFENGLQDIINTDMSYIKSIKLLNNLKENLTPLSEELNNIENHYFGLPIINYFLSNKNEQLLAFIDKQSENIKKNFFNFDQSDILELKKLSNEESVIIKKLQNLSDKEIQELDFDYEESTNMKKLLSSNKNLSIKYLDHFAVCFKRSIALFVESFWSLNVKRDHVLRVHYPGSTNSKLTACTTKDGAFTQFFPLRFSNIIDEISSVCCKTNSAD